MGRYHLLDLSVLARGYSLCFRSWAVPADAANSWGAAENALPCIPAGGPEGPVGPGAHLRVVPQLGPGTSSPWFVKRKWDRLLAVRL